MKIIVVLPAYNCAKTLKKTISEIPEMVNEIVLVDDFSNDGTYHLAFDLGLKHVMRHNANFGYGANQKTCYDYALSLHADIIIMLHPDYQYDPKLIPYIVNKINNGAQIVFASRLLHGVQAVKNGMPIYKYISNRILTFFQNICFKKHLSEYHTGYRAYTKDVLARIDYHKLSNDFIFDNQMIIEAFKCGYNIEEIYCPAKYDSLSSSINFFRSLNYGIKVLINTIKYKLAG